jgi:hypothetical protein
MLPFVFTVSQLGQNLFAPPNVKGWPGGEAWINSTTLLRRKQFLEALFRDDDSGMAAAANMKPAPAVENPRQRAARVMAKVRFEPGPWLGQLPRADADSVQRVLLAAAPASALPPEAHGAHAVRLLTQDPVYQLK